jgi:hypothetical protein
MASLDESTNGGGLATRDFPMIRAPEYLKPGMGRQVVNALYGSAFAAGCWQEDFRTCVNGKKIHAFSTCNFGEATLDGEVDLTFSDATCSMASSGDSVTRNANFTLTGAAGATYAVSTPAVGQTLTRSENGFSYSVSGIQRVATNAAGTKLFDITVSSTADLTVSGSSRATRVVNGGTLVVANNLKAYTATLTPENVAWSASCNCPVSGTISGTLTGSKKGKYALELTGCGSANLTVDKSTSAVTFDRCGTI